MKNSIFILILFLSSITTWAQSTIGITGIRDTSFSINNEYQKLIKTYPFITKVPTLQPDNIIQEKDIIFRKTVEKNLLLDVFYPSAKSDKKRTAIIILHGGGWRSGNKSMHHPLAQTLTSMGYVCVTPEYRLSTEALYPAAVYDVKAAIRWVKQFAAKYNIDTNKVVISGHSAGGELAAFMGATNNVSSFDGDGMNEKFSENVNAVIDMDGTLAFVHPESGEGDDRKSISAATYWFGFSKTENPELWKQAAPLTHVGANTPPILFINSSVARMHAGREDFIAVLNANNIYSEVKTFEGSPHSFIFFEPWFSSTVVYINDFLNKVFSAKK